MPAHLASDNTSAVHPKIFKALEAANTGFAKAYGGDELTAKLEKTFRDIFDHQTLVVFPVFNGSAANALSLAALTQPFGAVIAHAQSHIQIDECGMPEFFTGGAKILLSHGAHGKVALGDVQGYISAAGEGGVHHVLPQALSLTQGTESGTVYTVPEITGLAKLAHDNGLKVHMDGARFANALVSLGVTPADMTWRAGVDVLSFGATKNGAMLAEAVVFFNADLAKEFGRRRKRAGQLASKQRFLAAQLLAYIEDGLWLDNARHANAMAARLAQGLPAGALAEPVEINEVFVKLPKALAEKLWSRGHQFYDWPPFGADVFRCVTSFATTVAEIDEFIADVKRG